MHAKIILLVVAFATLALSACETRERQALVPTREKAPEVVSGGIPDECKKAGRAQEEAQSTANLKLFDGAEFMKRADRLSAPDCAPGYEIGKPVPEAETQKVHGEAKAQAADREISNNSR